MICWTPRLRLEPIGPAGAADLRLVHDDDAVAPWYDGWRPTPAEAEERAREIGESWRRHDVHEWLADDRRTGELVGPRARARLGAPAAVLGPGPRNGDRSRRPRPAFDVLGVRAVVSCTARHNARSRAVMERIGMRIVGELRSRGTTEGEAAPRDDAPFVVGVLRRDEVSASRSPAPARPRSRW